jgi:ADP-ribose pyrophosphatase YjhB (NUDIX family)
VPEKNSHCSHCGHPFAKGQPWPRTCTACHARSYLGPAPVAVILVPVGSGLLAVRRAIEPRIGELSLPGGFVDLGESWQEAGAREVREETGAIIDARAIRDVCAISADDGKLIVFGLAPPLAVAPAFLANAEVSELVVIDRPLPLAFAPETRVVAAYFAGGL